MGNIYIGKKYNIYHIHMEAVNMKRLIITYLIFLEMMILVLQGGYYFKSMFVRSKIDNTNHGWGVVKNKEHRLPDIPQDEKNMLKAYDGIYSGSPDEKYIYLTIDLGYESGYTKSILDVLRENNVKATFFITLSYMDKNSSLVDRIIQEGHSLQNHTARYKHLDKIDDNAVKKEIVDLENAIYKRYSIKMRYLRLPYEEWSERVMKIAKDTGYKTVFWSIACVDWTDDKDVSYIYNNVMDNYHNGAVVLLHSVSKSSPEAMELIIKDLKNKGYKFKALDL